MSDVAWLAVLFVISFVCVAYSGWQVLCPMRLRRIRVIWLVSESLRATRLFLLASRRELTSPGFSNKVIRTPLT